MSARGTGSTSRRSAARRKPPAMTSLGSGSSPVTSPTKVTARSGSPSRVAGGGRVDDDAVAARHPRQRPRLPWLAMMKPPVTPRRAWSRETTTTQCRAVAVIRQPRRAADGTPQAKSWVPQSSSAARPGGQANRADPVCSMYSLRRVAALASARCIGTNWRVGVAHEREEEQPGVEVALAVAAVGEVVAAAQDPDAVEVAVVREPHVRGRPGSAARRRCPTAAKSGSSNSAGLPSGAPSLLVAPDRSAPAP